MSISSESNRNDYVGTGLLTTYDYSFRIFAESHLLVTKVLSDGTESTLVLNTDYTVTGVGDASGGTIVLTTALTSGATLTIRRVLPLTQPTDIRNQGSYFPEVIENALDRGIMIAQQHQDEVDRSLRCPENETSIGRMPSADDRASNFLAFDADGDPIASSGGISGSVPVSAFMETVLDDTTAGAARTTLGVAADGTTLEHSGSTIRIKDSGVVTAKINDGAVTNGKLATDSVSTVKIVDTAVTTPKIEGLAVTEEKIASGAVTEGKIASGAVTEGKIGSGAVTEAKIGSGAVTEAKIGSGAVTESKLGSASVSSAKLKTATGSASGGGGVTVDFVMNDYTFLPSMATWSSRDALGTYTNGSGDPGDTVGRLSKGNSQQYAFRWRYVSASDNPRIWVITDAAGVLLHVWESEDPPHQEEHDDDTNPFEAVQLEPGWKVFRAPVFEVSEINNLLKPVPKEKCGEFFKKFRDKIHEKEWVCDAKKMERHEDLILGVPEIKREMAKYWCFRKLLGKKSPSTAMRDMADYSFNDKRLVFKKNAEKHIG